MINLRFGLQNLFEFTVQNSRRITTFLFLFLLVFSLPSTIFSQTTDSLSVRVGVILEDNLFEEHSNVQDKTVTYSGYLYEYLAEIAKHTGWQYQFVKGTPSELSTKLQNNEIDIYCDPSRVNDEDSFASKVAAFRAGTKCIGVYVLENRPQLFLDGMNIGFVRDTDSLELFDEFNKNFHYDIVPFIYDNNANAQQALRNNEIAGLVAPNFQKMPSCNAIMMMSPEPFYFYVNRENIPFRTEFRIARRRITEETPNFFDMLAQRYFGTDFEIVSELTPEEQKLLQSQEVRMVGLIDNSPPFAMLNPQTEQLEGIFPDVIALMNKNNPALHLRCVAFDSLAQSVEALRNRDIDILITADYLQDGSFLYTRPIISSHNSICGARDAMLKANPRISVYTDRVNEVNFINSTYPNMKIVDAHTQSELYKNFIDGNSDLMMDIQLSIDYHRHKPALHNFNVLLTTPLMLYFRMAIHGDTHPELLGILNKSINAVPSKTIADIAFSHTFNVKSDGMPVSMFIRKYTPYLVLILFTSIVVTLGFYIRHLRNRYKQQQTQLMTDFVLGIGNRLALSRKMDDLAEREAHGAMVMFGMNDFKSVNSSYGQANGTAILKEISKWLKENFSPQNVFRYGGDKFLVCFEDVDEEEAHDRALTIIERFSFPWFTGAISYIGTITTTISLFDAKNKQSFKNIIGEVDFSYTEAKRTARPLLYCDTTLTSRFARQIEIIECLKYALDNDSFTLVVQPIFNVKKQKFYAGEILLRLKDKRLGTIAPSEFIPIAEQTGLINPIGLMLVEKACKQMREWIDAGIDVDRLGINVSVVQLMQIDFVNKTLGILNKYKLPMHALTMEITESVLADSPAHMIEALCELQDGGVRFSIDDFGTEYSSFSMLHQLPASSIKLDKTFIQKLDDHQRIKLMIKGIITMAHELGLAVISEGVESKKQRDFLVNECGTDMIQGYYYSEPIPFYQYEHILRLQDTNQNADTN